MEYLNKDVDPNPSLYPSGRYSWMRVMSGADESEFGSGNSGSVGIKMHGNLDLNGFSLINSSSGGGGGGTFAYSSYMNNTATITTPGGAGDHRSLIVLSGGSGVVQSNNLTIVSPNEIANPSTTALTGTLLVSVSVGVLCVGGASGAFDIWLDYNKGSTPVLTFQPDTEIEAIGISRRISAQFLIQPLAGSESFKIYLGDNSNAALTLKVYDFQLSVKEIASPSITINPPSNIYAYSSYNNNASQMTYTAGAGNKRMLIPLSGGTPVSQAGGLSVNAPNQIVNATTVPTTLLKMSVSLGVQCIGGATGAFDVWVDYDNGSTQVLTFQPTSEIETVGASRRVSGEFAVDPLGVGQAIQLYLGTNSADAVILRVYDFQVSLSEF